MVADQITQVVELTAEKLGVAVDMVYPMLVKQAQVECGEFHFILIVLGVAFTLFVLGMIGWTISEKNFNENLSFASGMAMLIFGAAAFVALILMFFELNSYLTALHNPEWWAVEYVLKLIN